MSRRSRAEGVAWRRIAWVTALVLATPAAVQASEPTETAAEQLFRAARALLGARDYAAACPMLEESLRLDPAPGTEFNLGRCYELAGRLASAERRYASVAAALHAAGDLAREEVARERLGAIAPRLSFLAVRLPPREGAPGESRVVVDGRELTGAERGGPFAVDRGAHEVIVERPGEPPWRDHVIVDAEAQTVAIDVPPGEASRSALDEPLSFSPIPSHPPAPPGSPGALGGQRIAALTLLGAGVVAGGVGAFFGVRAFQLGDEARRDCPSRCTAVGLSEVSASHTSGDASTASFLAFGALVATGTVLWLTAPSHRNAVGVAVVPAGARTEVLLQGRF